MPRRCHVSPAHMPCLPCGDRGIRHAASHELSAHARAVGRRPGELPQVDPARKEQYLSDAEFELHMTASRAEFVAMKNWKKLRLKKDAGLF